MTKTINLMNGDCLELIKDIPDGSIDLVLTDPPYGMIRGIGLDGWDNGTTYWDKALPTNQMFEQLSRVLRQNGKAVLFSKQPYTTELISNQTPSLQHCYNAIWFKNCAGNPP